MKRGEVVILEVLFSDRQGSKVRPALVVQSDFSNERLTDTIVAIITSSPRRFTDSGTQLRIDPASEAGKSSGLRALSVAQCENLVTVDKSFIQAQIGHLSESLMRDADKCLKVTLGIR
jgi:mRNA-degrading endonuclease toxin of MazEF toxin-antitoxin module